MAQIHSHTMAFTAKKTSKMLCALGGMLEALAEGVRSAGRNVTSAADAVRTPRRCCYNHDFLVVTASAAAHGRFVSQA